MMSFEEDDEKPKTFFGLEMGDSVTYIIVFILAVIFIRQVSALF